MKIELDKDLKDLINNCSPKAVKLLNNLGLKHDTRVKAVFEVCDEDEGYYFRAQVEGRILVAGENPVEKPVIWFEEAVDDESEERYLIPLNEVEYVELYKRRGIFSE